MLSLFDQQLGLTNAGKRPSTDLLWVSPECTNHSQAKGIRAADRVPDLFGQTLPADAAERSRATMWDVVRFVEAKLLAGRPYLGFVVENVVEVVKWMPYRAWRIALEDLGYCLHTVYLNSMFAQAGGLGAPQSRDRWYTVGHLAGLGRCPDLDRWTRPDATCDGCGITTKPIQAWKRPDRPWGRYGNHGQYVWACPTTACRGARVYPTVLPAAVAIDWGLAGTRIGDRSTSLADKTMARITAGLHRYARPLMVPTGGTWRTDAAPLDTPMPTRTTRENDGIAVPPLADGQGDPELVAPPMVVALEGRATVAHVRPVDRPLRAQTGRHQDALVVPMRNHGVARPAGGDALPTVTAAGNHHGLLTWPELLVPYYGTGVPRPVATPMGTLSTVDRFGLLDGGAAGSLDPLDCFFRMLALHEIQLGMAFDPGYVILGTRREQVRQVGNAVTPPAARDLIAALVETITGDTPQIRTPNTARELVGATT
jgi:DNA (cytosine-5)-methyltransferase 1